MVLSLPNFGSSAPLALTRHATAVKPKPIQTVQDVPNTDARPATRAEKDLAPLVGTALPRDRFTRHSLKITGLESSQAHSRSDSETDRHEASPERNTRRMELEKPLPLSKIIESSRSAILIPEFDFPLSAPQTGLITTERTGDLIPPVETTLEPRPLKRSRILALEEGERNPRPPSRGVKRTRHTSPPPLAHDIQGLITPLTSDGLQNIEFSSLKGELSRKDSIGEGMVLQYLVKTFDTARQVDDLKATIQEQRAKLVSMRDERTQLNNQVKLREIEVECRTAELRAQAKTIEKLKIKADSLSKFLQGLATDQSRLKSEHEIISRDLQKLPAEVEPLSIQIKSISEDVENAIERSHGQRSTFKLLGEYEERVQQRKFQQVIDILRADLNLKSGLLAEERDRCWRFEKALQDHKAEKQEVIEGIAKHRDDILGAIVQFRTWVLETNREAVNAKAESLAILKEILEKIKAQENVMQGNARDIVSSLAEIKTISSSASDIMDGKLLSTMLTLTKLQAIVDEESKKREAIVSSVLDQKGFLEDLSAQMITRNHELVANFDEKDKLWDDLSSEKMVRATQDGTIADLHRQLDGINVQSGENKKAYHKLQQDYEILRGQHDTQKLELNSQTDRVSFLKQASDSWEAKVDVVTSEKPNLARDLAASQEKLRAASIRVTEQQERIKMITEERSALNSTLEWAQKQIHQLQTVDPPTLNKEPSCHSFLATTGPFKGGASISNGAGSFRPASLGPETITEDISDTESCAKSPPRKEEKTRPVPKPRVVLDGKETPRALRRSSRKPADH
ncbi:MAG: hypothetical protein M1814_006216 [Vezdaea aestivalis]|nr:MAG: hypothetical protein M1814_006216 [Vezdaea aestivalis]